MRTTEPDASGLTETDDAASDSPEAEDATPDPTESSEPGDDTSELGTLADLSPDWVEDDVHARTDDEGGEQR